MELIRIDVDNRLYVIAAGAGYSCYGFDVLDRKARKIAAWLYVHPRYTGRWTTPRTFSAVGTAEHFAECSDMFDRARELCRVTGDRCPVELIPALNGLEGRRVEVSAPDGYKRRFWVGKSTGWMPCHLEIARINCSGGSPVYLPDGATVRVIR